MSRKGLIGIVCAGLVAAVLVLAWPKTGREAEEPALAEPQVELEVLPAEPPHVVFEEAPLTGEEVHLMPLSSDEELPAEGDRVHLLFQPYPPNLPIVETVSYSSRVPWLIGRSAFLGDYASHYKTSKHFISRSLKGARNYLSDTVSKGERFNVLREDREIAFHLVADLSRLKLWLYAVDETQDERYLLKSYPICAGKLDESSLSGSLTPTGVFSLGSEIAVYREGMMGRFRGEPCEMITVFGRRWIPFDKELARCSGPCKGLGIHGVPWDKNPETGEYREKVHCLGTYESSGCIRLATEDVEELFAIVVSRPSYVHVVKDFVDAQLPGRVL